MPQGDFFQTYCLDKTHNSTESFVSVCVFVFLSYKFLQIKFLLSFSHHARLALPKPQLLVGFVEWYLICLACATLIVIFLINCVLYFGAWDCVYDIHRPVIQCVGLRSKLFHVKMRYIYFFMNVQLISMCVNYMTNLCIL